MRLMVKGCVNCATRVVRIFGVDSQSVWLRLLTSENNRIDFEKQG